ncbi:hypothetical protein ACFX14_045756 [Malus domestica]
MRNARAVVSELVTELKGHEDQGRKSGLVRPRTREKQRKLRGMNSPKARDRAATTTEGTTTGTKVGKSQR